MESANQAVDSEYRIPIGVYRIAWLGLLIPGAMAILFTYLLALGSPDVVWVRVLGMEMRLGDWPARLIPFAVTIVVVSVPILVCLYVMKGRMWAYYLLLAGALYSLASVVWQALMTAIGRASMAQLNLVLQPVISVIIVIVLVRSYAHYRKYAMYASRHEP